MDVPSATCSPIFSVRIVSIAVSSRIGLTRAETSYPLFRPAPNCLRVLNFLDRKPRWLKPAPLSENEIGCLTREEGEGIRVAIISNGKSSAGDGGGETHWPKCGLAPRVGRRGRSRQLSQFK